MELRQLRYFVAIVDHGSLSRAALVLHVAQPALTQQLRQLEEELGVQLLHRSAQGVLSTDAGKVFYEHAQAILKQVADAQAAVVQSAERPSGSVTLGLPHSISGALALPLLTAIRQRYPEITLQLTEEITGTASAESPSPRKLSARASLPQRTWTSTPSAAARVASCWRCVKGPPRSIVET